MKRMRLTLLASWKESGYGYIIGNVLVKDKSEKILMDDTDMYFNFDKFLDMIVKKFRNNPRFVWQEATYHTKTKVFEIIMEDKGKGIEKKL